MTVPRRTEASSFFAGIHWGLLRTQKVWLQAQPAEEAQGLLALLDALQDTAVDDLGYPTRQVFGPAAAEPASRRPSDGRRRPPRLRGRPHEALSVP